MLRVLLNRYTPKEIHALLKFLPQENAQGIMDQNIQSSDLEPIFQKPEKALSNIHYSWIQPVLQRFPESMQSTITSALTTEQISGLKVSSPKVISHVAKSFVLNQIYHHLDIHEHFPIEYLPETEFSSLVRWRKAELLNLMDFLGLHDLASEARRIVDRNQLKNIYNCLNSKQLHYLKSCLYQKEKLISSKFDIDLSQKDCRPLKLLIHRRGLLRLAKALCGQHPDLVWHIAHILDRGRGKILLEAYQVEELPEITKILKQQVLNLINFLKNE